MLENEAHKYDCGVAEGQASGDYAHTYSHCVCQESHTTAVVHRYLLVRALTPLSVELRYYIGVVLVQGHCAVHISQGLHLLL